MTSTLRNAILSTAIAATTAISAGSAFGASVQAPTGSIVSIDRAAHTLTVRDEGRTFRVAIPKGAQVAIAPLSSRGTTVDFEHLMVGMQYRGIR
ncbi:MAG TPA: hypothetical protein PLF26_05390 [Blastocatellia bacterium]|nr:hypothetical protein [Blastocatellia bacterium]